MPRRIIAMRFVTRTVVTRSIIIITFILVFTISGGLGKATRNKQLFRKTAFADLRWLFLFLASQVGIRVWIRHMTLNL